ncbi:MAG: bifunctional UDP-N-acetylglucosamine diphosphorylase/glucosamine-1-phosphate N-acetyltransferase GlmU [Bacteriovoracaceae bacterium]|nr:bifunctional UDP-N-acetylglucosamine diphosphorylase/glucosamine-1-phosphate N-acetyltransferase GlmU [Bacteriovoracaceae bacterium]
MADSIGIALLAAGKGTRMKIETAKALAPLLGRSLMDFVIDGVSAFSEKFKLDAHIGVVIGHRREDVQKHVLSTYPKRTDISFAIQEQQKGTADALKSYFQGTSKAWKQKYTMVICADTPLISENELSQLFEQLSQNPKLEGVAATFKTNDPTGYGRIVRSSKGFHITEEKDADAETKKIQEVNSGLYIFKTDFIKKHLEEIDNKNKSGEFYLTDLFQDEYEVKPLLFANEMVFHGVNTLDQLEEAELHLRKKKTKILKNKGVRFYDADTCYLDWQVEIGSGSVIYPNVVIQGATVIENDCVIEMGNTIKNSRIGRATTIFANSYIDGAQVAAEVNIGPFARLRPGTELADKVKIGNFVEVKKSQLAKGVKVSHLSYVGDCEIGQESNIGCGFISCNYDGVNKHKTKIGENTFIGSDVQAVAPITIGSDAFIAAGSTITSNVPDGAFAIARTKQVTKPDLAKKFLPKKVKSSSY